MAAEKRQASNIQAPEDTQHSMPTKRGARISVPLESGRRGGAGLSAQVLGFSRGVKGVGENWPNSHIFPPFLTWPLREFFCRGWRTGTRSNREISEQRDQTKMRGLMTENRWCKMLVFTTLKKGSPAFCRKPPQQNVRLLFAFCSHKNNIFFVKCFHTGMAEAKIHVKD